MGEYRIRYYSRGNVGYDGSISDELREIAEKALELIKEGHSVSDVIDELSDDEFFEDVGRGIYEDEGAIVIADECITDGASYGYEEARIYYDDRKDYIPNARKAFEEWLKKTGAKKFEICTDVSDLSPLYFAEEYEGDVVDAEGARSFIKEVLDCIDSYEFADAVHSDTFQNPYGVMDEDWGYTHTDEYFEINITIVDTFYGDIEDTVRVYVYTEEESEATEEEERETEEEKQEREELNKATEEITSGWDERVFRGATVCTTCVKKWMEMGKPFACITRQTYTTSWENKLGRTFHEHTRVIHLTAPFFVYVPVLIFEDGQLRHLWWHGNYTHSPVTLCGEDFLDQTKIGYTAEGLRSAEFKLLDVLGTNFARTLFFRKFTKKYPGELLHHSEVGSKMWWEKDMSGHMRYLLEDSRVLRTLRNRGVQEGAEREYLDKALYYRVVELTPTIESLIDIVKEVKRAHKERTRRWTYRKLLHREGQ